MKTSKSLLFIYPQLRSFVKKDIELLSKSYEVISKGFIASNKFLWPFVWLYQFIYLLLKAPSCSAIVVFFGGHHSLMPTLVGRLLKKPTMIIIGGTDAANFPEINYGNFRKQPLKWVTQKSYKWANLLVPVHKALEGFDYNYDSLTNAQQGVKPFVPGLNTPFLAVNNGYDAEKFLAKTSFTERPKDFLTIGTNFHENHNFRRKGIDLIIEAARALPSASFTIIGLIPTALKDLPSNVNAISKVPFEEIMEYCNSHKYYFQLSMMEGLPNALCEAMLCGCVPVVSAMGSLPEVVGDSGFILPKRSSSDLIELLNGVLEQDNEPLSEEARMRIIKNYPIHFREAGLVKCVEQLFSN